MGGDDKFRKSLSSAISLDLSGLETVLTNVHGSIEDQEKSLKSLATRVVQVEHSRGQEKQLKNSIEEILERMLAAEEGVRSLESRTKCLDSLQNRVRSMEEQLAASSADLQVALKTGIKDTHDHFEEQMKRLKNLVTLGEAKVAECSQRFDIICTDVEDHTLQLKQLGNKLQQVEENALLAVGHGGLISDLRQRQDDLKGACDSEFATLSTTLRSKADSAAVETMRKDLEQGNLAVQKEMMAITEGQDKLRERSEQYSKHLERHDSTIENLHLDLQSLRNASESRTATAAGTAHCLSCYGQRPQSPPRIQRGNDGTTYGCKESAQRGVQVQAGRVRPPRTVPSIPSAIRDCIPQASPFEAQRRMLASAAEKANWSKTATPLTATPSGSRPASATIPGTHKSRLSRPGTAHSYQSLSSDRSLPLLERIDWSEPIIVDDDSADPLPQGF